jgi:hypothetical protein
MNNNSTRIAQTTEESQKSATATNIKPSAHQESATQQTKRKKKRNHGKPANSFSRRLWTEKASR